MAAQLAASLPARSAVSAQGQQQAGGAAGKPKDGGSFNVPARMEEALDVEGNIELKEVELNGMAILKILKHSTDPAQPQPSASSSANYQGRDRENHHANDAIGLLLGIDLSGTMEVSDCFQIPPVDASGRGDKLDANSYSTHLLHNLSQSGISQDNLVGVYISTHTSAFSLSGNGGVGGTGGFLTRGVVDLMQAVERTQGGRGRAVLVVHDAARSVGGDISIKAYKFSEGFNAALAKQRFDTLSLVEHRLTPATLLTPLVIRTKNPGALSALFASLAAPPPSTLTTSLRNPSLATLPSSFLPLQNTTPTALPSSLGTTLSALNILSQEANNLAYQSRQIAREKARHDAAVQARVEENEQRKRQGLQPLPDVAEPRAGKLAEPSRLELLACLGAVDAAAKGLAAEAGKGLAKAYAV
jgi:translation initiation factor 3 subunit H